MEYVWECMWVYEGLNMCGGCCVSGNACVSACGSMCGNVCESSNNGSSCCSGIRYYYL